MMKNKQRPAVLLLLLLFTAVYLSAQTQEELSVRRFGLFVAANDGGTDRQRLLYADDDVAVLSRTMTELGGISPVDETTLYEPDPQVLDDAFASMYHAVAGAEQARRTEVFFYYSGHSDERGIMLGDDLYTYVALRENLESLNADVIVAVLDSCASGAFTRGKGGVRRAPFLVDDSSSMEGHAFLTSSSADEVSQESDAIGGSFFTHYLVSGLRGAADTTRDGRVTLNEIYQHTYAETLARTEGTLGGAQHPNYDIRLNGAGDLVLTDLSRPDAAMELDASIVGRVAVRDETGRLVAEINKRSEESVTLALPAGVYAVGLEENKNRYSGEVEISRGDTITVTEASLKRRRPERTEFRGEEEAERRSHPFAFGVVPGLSFPNADDAVAHFMIGVPIAAAWGIEGAQIGLIMSMSEAGVDGLQTAAIGSLNEGPLSGLQTSGIFSHSGTAASGAQISGIYNRLGGPLEGAQIAGIFNVTSGDIDGAQIAGIFNNSSASVQGSQIAGIWNNADGSVTGAQIGLANVAGTVTGAQVGLMNVSGSSTGVSVGLVNYSRDMRAVPIGLVNISQGGILDLDFRWESDNRKYITFKSGNRYFYTRFIMGFTEWNFFQNPETLVFGFGSGFRLTLRPLYFEFEIDGRMALADHTSYGSTQEFFENFLVLPTFSLTAGVGKRIGAYVGVGMTLKTQGMNRHSVLLQNSGYVNFTDDGAWGASFKFYAGVHL